MSGRDEAIFLLEADGSLERVPLHAYVIVRPGA